MRQEVQIPDHMKALPRDKHGRPIPWFVAYINDPDDPTKGDWDFRIAGTDKLHDAVLLSRCWVCGNPRGSYATFVIGPMCAVNRISSEPPSHRDCGIYSARACPFLSTPNMVRRDRNLPDDMVAPGGIMIPRNPGVTMVWVSRRWREIRDPNGKLLFNIGDPEQVYWYVRGRDATRDEVLASIESGLPSLKQEIHSARDLRKLDADVARALELVPAS